jgi:hypothetical protein
MKKLVVRYILLSVFLCSYLGNACAAVECYARYTTNGKACDLANTSFEVKTCCHKKESVRRSLCTHVRFNQDKTCPLKYVVAKTLDAFVKAEHAKHISEVSGPFAGIFLPLAMHGQGISLSVLTTVSPPNLFIVQRNLRI